jgi:tetratricopeptide (TPR) repeat protein
MRQTTLVTIALMLLFTTAFGQSVYSGRELPAFSVETLDGEPFLSSSLQGNPVMLVYVEPEQNRSSELLEDVERMLGRGLTVKVYSISRHRPETWNHNTALLLDSDGQLYSDWRIRVFPVAVLVNVDGVIQKVFHGYTRAEHDELADELRVLSGDISREDLDKARESGAVVGEELPAEEFVQIGQKHWHAGFVDRAREAWENALKLNPELMDARVYLARYFLKTGNADTAATILETPLANSPDCDTWLLDAEIKMTMGDLDAAEAAAESALDLNRRSFDAKLMLAEIYLERGWPEDAQDLVKEVRLLRKEDPRAAYLLGRAAEQQGNMELAIQFYREAFELIQGRR